MRYEAYVRELPPKQNYYRTRHTSLARRQYSLTFALISLGRTDRNGSHCPQNAELLRAAPLSTV